MHASGTMPGVLCVFCRQRPVDPVWRPFCSERCKMLDLGAWLSERYRVAGDPVPTTTDADEDGRQFASASCVWGLAPRL